MTRKRKLIRNLSVVALALAMSARIFPQEGDLVPLADLKPLETSTKILNEHGFQYGLSTANTMYYDSLLVKSDKTTIKAPLYLGFYRPYVRYLYNETHQADVRVKINYKLDADADTAKNENVGNGSISAEVFSVRLHSDRHSLVVGRAFQKVGRGLLFANFADGVNYTGTFPLFQVKGAAFYSGQYGTCGLSIQGCDFNDNSTNKNPYDLVPGRAADVQLADAGKRVFVAGEINSRPYYGSRVSFQTLYSKDMNTTTKSDGSIYTFDPLYFALGFSGYIVIPQLRYMAEAIYQTGSTYNKVSNKVSEATTISAYAFQGDIMYNFKFLEDVIAPGLVAQYAFGSGRDEKSAGGPGEASQANISGVDNNFYYFGAYSAGLALKPRLANISVYRFGFQFKPLYMFHDFKNLMLSAKYSLYQKKNADVKISDSRATKSSTNIGSGIDVQILYDFRSDLKFFYSYGAFVPGGAYDEKVTTQHVHLFSANIFF